MPSCGRTLAENEYIFSLEEIFQGRPVVESTFTHSIVNDGRESTEQQHADRKLILKIQIFVEMQSNRQVSNNVPYFPLQWETTVERLVSPKKLELWRSVTITDMCRFGCHQMELLARLSSVLLKCILFPAVVDEVPRYIFVMT